MRTNKYRTLQNWFTSQINNQLLKLASIHPFFILVYRNRGGFLSYIGFIWNIGALHPYWRKEFGTKLILRLQIFCVGSFPKQICLCQKGKFILWPSITLYPMITDHPVADDMDHPVFFSQSIVPCLVDFPPNKNKSYRYKYQDFFL